MGEGVSNPLEAVPFSSGELWPAPCTWTSVPQLPGGLVDSELELSGAARDVRGAAPGEPPVVVREAEVYATFDPSRVLVLLETRPDAPWTQAMIGQRSGGGFRRFLDQATPTDVDASLVRQLLEDLPGAALISGYSSLRIARRMGGNPGDLTPPAVLAHMTDICSGWRDGGTAMRSISAGDGVPVQICPVAPDLNDTPGGSGGWRRFPPLELDWMRRRRLVDVTFSDDGQSAEIWGDVPRHHRRSARGRSRGERCEERTRIATRAESILPVALSRYCTSIRCPGISRCRQMDGFSLHSPLTPRVLPFSECPAAALEVGALSGVLMSELAKTVPVALFSVKSCTHLNDLLRNIGGMAGVLAG